MKNNINYKETNSEVILQIKKPSLRYLNEFTRLKCGSDLLRSKVFPNAKEITESMGAYNALRTHLQGDFPLGDDKITCVVVGDGTTPRTGALFAYRTNWNVVSIDPEMDRDFMKPGDTLEEWQDIERLWVARKKIEEVSLDHIVGKLLIVCVHSHAKLSECVKKRPSSPKTIINLPCCVKPDLNIKPDISYEDYAIHSEKRIVEIYKDV